MRVKCLAQGHNTMSPARARTRTARSGVERTNQEATAPPTLPSKKGLKFPEDGYSLRPKIKEIYEKIPSVGEYGCFLELIHNTQRFAP